MEWGDKEDRERIDLCIDPSSTQQLHLYAQTFRTPSCPKSLTFHSKTLPKSDLSSLQYLLKELAESGRQITRLKFKSIPLKRMLPLVRACLFKCQIKALSVNKDREMKGDTLSNLISIIQEAQTQKISLSHNSLQDEGANLARLIPADKMLQQKLEADLREIDLSRCQLRSIDIDSLFQQLSENKTIRSINLRYNNICEKGIQLIGRVLQTNHSLVSVDIRDNPGVSDILTEKIYHCLKRNMEIFKTQTLTKEGRHYQRSNDSVVSQSASIACAGCQKYRSLLDEKDREIKWLRKELGAKLQQVSEIISDPNRSVLHHLSSLSSQIRRIGRDSPEAAERMEVLISNLTRLMDNTQHTQNMVSFQQSHSINQTVAINIGSSSLSLGLPRELSQIQGSQLNITVKGGVEDESGVMQFQQRRYQEE